MPLFAPAFIRCMGLIFGSSPLSKLRGEGFLEASSATFPGIVVAISTFIITPVDLVTQRGTGVLRRFYVTPLGPALYLATDIVSRLTLGLISSAAMHAITILGFGIRSTSAGAFISTFAVTMLGLTAFLVAGYLIAGWFHNADVTQGLGSILVYPFVFTPGAAVPLAMLPPSTLSITRYSPVTQLTYLT